MDLFGTRRKHVETMEREVLSNPTPQNLVALIERYIALGDEVRALDIARRAIERFPDSEQCIAAHQIVRRIQLQSEIQQLNRALRKDPTVSDYVRLSTLHLSELGDRNKAFEIALEGLTRFPSSDGLHMICGQIRMERFHKGYLGNDLTEAVRHFEEARRANASNLKALMHLGRLYAEIGVYAQAKDLLARVVQMEPEAPHMAAVLRIVEDHLGEAVPQVEDALMHIERLHALSPVGQEIRKLYEPATAEPSTVHIDPARIEQFLAGFQSISGYKCSLALTSEGTPMAGHTRGGVPAEQFQATVQGLYRTMLESCRKMDIGSFGIGDLETPVGRVILAAVKGQVLAIFSDYPAKKQDIDAAVERYQAFAAIR